MMYGSIQRWGNSQGIRLPKAALNIANLSENDEVEIIATEKDITIRKSRRSKTLEDLFAGYGGDYLPAELSDVRDAAGKEVMD
ncbi:MAG: AbrB/MazE/SpoVT family DNA-binding domain-containing protein [Oscillospiraceae bacterium]|jgi:antitoxin MazE|nr:AbrB/MazE/SpoVT family DNA-binding domain-containing protein [Oscillospiraceae bacterium]